MQQNCILKREKKKPHNRLGSDGGRTPVHTYCTQEKLNKNEERQTILLSLYRNIYFDLRSLFVKRKFASFKISSPIGISRIEIALDLFIFFAFHYVFVLFSSSFPVKWQLKKIFFITKYTFEFAFRLCAMYSSSTNTLNNI